jgi:hypothetical protein
MGKPGIGKLAHPGAQQQQGQQKIGGGGGEGVRVGEAVGQDSIELQRLYAGALHIRIYVYAYAY